MKKITIREHGPVEAAKFYRFLRSLNPKFKIVPGDPKTNQQDYAGLYIASRSHDLNVFENASDGVWEFVCGVCQLWFPERTIYNPNGVIYKRGWREILSVCATKGLINIPRYLGGNGGILRHGKPSVREIV